MARTNLPGRQITDATVQRQDLDTTTAGQAVVRRLIQGTGISFSSTGVDSGTGDVTINATTGGSSGWATPVTATGTAVSQNIALPESGLTPKDVYVFVNGVRWQTNEYTIVGSTLSMTTNAVGDSIEIIKPAGSQGVKGDTGTFNDGTYGDITISSSATVFTLVNKAVSFAKIQDVATGSILGRVTAASGSIEVLTPAQVKTLLDLAGTNTGDQTITLTGDVTGTGTGSFATTIGANKVTLAMMAQIATASFLGRDTAATGNVEVLSTATARTMLAINNVDNTSDANKPVSTAQASAIALKQDFITAGTTGQYWRGDKSWQTLDKAAVGLGSVDNTADSAKNVLSATKLTTARNINGVAFDGTGNITINAVDSTPRIATSLMGVANGVATLDTNGKLVATQLPAIAISSTSVVASQAAQLALTAQEGDVAIRTDLGQTYIHNGGVAGTMADWTQLATPTDQVLSFNTRTGAITLLSADVTGALGYTPTSVTGLTGTQSVAAFKTGLSLVKADVGLGNVDNTSDVNKPVSTAQQSALDLKLNISAYTAADVLAKLLTVDGAASGLDADLLDGLNSTAFAQLAAGSNTFTGTISASNLSGTNTGDQTNVTGSAGSVSGTNVVTYANIVQAAALSVTGNATNATANRTDITAAADFNILRRSGTAIGFGAIDLSQAGAVGTSRLAFANLTQGSALSVLGVTGNATANVASIAAGADYNILRRSGTTVGFGAIDLSQAGAVGTSRLALSNIAQIATLTVLGNSTGGTADASPLTMTTLTGMLNTFTSTLKGLVPAPASATNKYLRDDGTWQQDIVAVTLVVDAGGAILTTGIKGSIPMEFSGTIVAWTLVALNAGNLVMDIWKDTYANYPPTVADTITGSAKPTLVGSDKATSSTLTGWNTSITAGDVLRFNIDSNDVITRVTLSLRIYRA